MDSTLIDIQQQLAQVALQREQERFTAHEAAMKDLAEAKAREEQRQAAAQEEIRAATEKATKREQARKEAEAERMREDAELRSLSEQELNRKQDALDRTIRMKEEIKRRMDELEHAEELAKRQLRDVMLQNITPAGPEPGLTNPLQRFLQKEPE